MRMMANLSPGVPGLIPEAPGSFPVFVLMFRLFWFVCVRWFRLFGVLVSACFDHDPPTFGRGRLGGSIPSSLPNGV